MRHESLLLLNEFQCAHTSCWLNALSFKHERKRVCYLSRSGGNLKFKSGKKDSRDQDITVLTVEWIISAKLELSQGGLAQRNNRTQRFLSLKSSQLHRPWLRA